MAAHTAFMAGTRGIAGDNGVRGVVPFAVLHVMGQSPMALAAVAGIHADGNPALVAAGDHMLAAGSVAVFALDIGYVFQCVRNSVPISGLHNIRRGPP